MNVGLLVLAPILLAGHASLWIPIWNRVESTAMPRWIKTRISSFSKVACILLPPLVLAGYVLRAQFPWAVPYIEGYGAICAVVAFCVIPSGLVRRFGRSYSTQLRDCQSHFESVPTSKKITNQTKKRDRILFSLPWNQSFEFEHNQKEIEIPRLSPELDGLSIAHLTDLHFTGAVGRSFYDRVIERVNDSRPDIIAVTGDLVDDWRCMNWLPATLGKLRAKHGVFVILGNHDCKHNLSEMRGLLTKLGLFALGGRVKKITVRGKQILLAGNELPWIAPASDMSDYPRTPNEHTLRVLLSHSPDQLPWARYNNFDLMLAGHTHGGQFRLPWFGAVVCPSSRPLAFASGTFYEPPTLLHVSRGLSGEVPLRLNCRPEVTQLIVRCPKLVHQEYLHRQELGELARIQNEIGQAISMSEEVRQQESPQPSETNVRDEVRLAGEAIRSSDFTFDLGAMPEEAYHD